jgi:hypothetical protein
MDSNNKHF